MKLTPDPRYAQLAAHNYLPLAEAHKAIGVGKSTVYRWVAEQQLEVLNGFDGPVVRVGDLKATQARMRRGRPRHQNSPNSEISNKSEKSEIKSS